MSTMGALGVGLIGALQGAEANVILEKFELDSSVDAQDSTQVQVNLQTRGGRAQYQTQIEQKGMVIRLPNVQLSEAQTEAGFPVVLDGSRRFIARALPDAQTGGVKLVLPNLPTDQVIVSVSQKNLPALAHASQAAESRVGITPHLSRLAKASAGRTTASKPLASIRPVDTPEGLNTPAASQASPEAQAASSVSAAALREGKSMPLRAPETASKTPLQETAGIEMAPGLMGLLNQLDFYAEVSMLKSVLQWGSLLVVFLGCGLLGGTMVFTVLGWMIDNLLPERLIETARQQIWSADDLLVADQGFMRSNAVLQPAINAGNFPDLQLLANTPDPYTPDDAHEIALKANRLEAALSEAIKALEDKPTLNETTYRNQSPSIYTATPKPIEPLSTSTTSEICANTALEDVRELALSAHQGKGVLKSLAKKLRDVRFS
ncbi:MAG: hypothetical protein VKJ06_06575 [Vampirovibrionales bacterium]|nr:hypothetical protein [Vampirovibrionales bacterium]